MVSLGAIIYLVARGAPRVTGTTVLPARKGYFDRLAHKFPLEKADAFVSAALEKFLRKFKIVILKLDNLVARHLTNLVKQPNSRLNNGSRPSEAGERGKNEIIGGASEKPVIFERQEKEKLEDVVSEEAGTMK